VRRTSEFTPPDYAAIRTLHAGEQSAQSIGAALAAGYFETGRGLVMNEECDVDGRMEIYQTAGRISDTIPAFMAAMQSAEEFSLRGSGELGSAVVEHRVDYYRDLTVGDRFVILSGLHSFGEKTMRLSHLLFNPESGVLALHSQGVGVALDLNARRAVPFSADRRQRMQARVVRTP
jgi:acyl-CoA thioester hydrolase